MRTRKEILKDFKENNPMTDRGLIIELLLDIRDSLIKEEDTPSTKYDHDSYIKGLGEGIQAERDGVTYDEGKDSTKNEPEVLNKQDTKGKICECGHISEGHRWALDVEECYNCDCKKFREDRQHAPGGKNGK